MTIKEDLMRVYAYGQGPYFQAIQAIPSYKAELARTSTDYNKGFWSNPLGIIPEFTADEFEKQREKYQAKYGSTVNVPGFNDVVHWKIPPKITPEQMAAHRFAQKRKLPSPLNADQLQLLAVKKQRFLKALASPTPAWVKNVGAVMTSLDNLQDGMITAAVLGRLTAKIIPSLRNKILPGIGWVLLGSDILNLFNAFTWTSFAANGAKRSIEGTADRNPFHAKAKAKRATALSRKFLTFGEFIQIAQTTDQAIGFGLCLGGIIGMVTDLASRANDYAMPAQPRTWKTWEEFQLSDQAFYNKLTTDWEALKDYTNLTLKWGKNLDKLVQQKMLAAPDVAADWMKNKFVIAWDRIKQAVPNAIKSFASQLTAAMIAATNVGAMPADDKALVYLSLGLSSQGVADYWIANEPLNATRDIRSYRFRPPQPTDPSTIYLLEEGMPNWRESLKWPHLDLPSATAEELAYTYAPRIKDQFQTYALQNAHDLSAAFAAQQTIPFVQNITRALSDDHQAVTSRSAYAQVAVNLARDIYIMPPDTPAPIIARFADWIGVYERTIGQVPSTKEAAAQGEVLGIKWMRSFPRRTFNAAYKLFPQWQAIQDQLEDLYIAD